MKIEIDRICIDLDDVLVDFHTPIMNWHNDIYGTSLRLQDFTTYRFNLVWGGTGEEAIKKVDNFQHSDYFKKILPVKGSIEVINFLLQRGKKLFVSTSRSDSFREDTERTLEKYFRGKFLDVFYSSNYYTKRKNCGKSKGQICKDLGALLIDDSLDYIKQCLSLQIIGILFGDYPWNQDGTLPFGISRAKDWKEVLEKLI